MPKNAPAFCTSEVIPVQKVSLPAICCGGRGPWRLEVLAEDGADQVEAEEADAPEADDARRRPGACRRSCSAATAGRRTARRASRACGRARVGRQLRSSPGRGLPPLGLLEAAGRSGSPAGRGAGRSGTSPARRCRWRPISSSSPRPMPMRAASMLPTAESAWSQPSANGRARSGITSATSDDADGELAADAQAGQEAVERRSPRPRSRRRSGP